MPYDTNPKLPRLRMRAAQLVIRDGWSTRAVARYTGFDQSTIVRWVAKARQVNHRQVIPTASCRPQHHPHALSRELVNHILVLRQERQQCAEILHYRLIKEGLVVSLSSVKRVLKRAGCSRFSRWKKWHRYPPRPLPERPGALVQQAGLESGVPASALPGTHSHRQ